MFIKGFDKDLKCRGMQFEVGKIYEVEGAPKLCENGFHYCDSIEDVHDFYQLYKSKGNRFCEIEALGDIDYSKKKSCTNKIKIVREIVGDELEKLVNVGNENTGILNTGDQNAGNRNTGDMNTGYRNTGNMNTGNRNAGNMNTGNRNTGNMNAGDWNAGDWNTCDYSDGFFCTESPKINIFNMPSEMTHRDFIHSKYYEALMSSRFVLTDWVEYTAEEKEDDKEKEMIGGYLKTYTYREACSNWWEKMTEENKEIIKSIPNFSAEIFEEITGIKV